MRLGGRVVGPSRVREGNVGVGFGDGVVRLRSGSLGSGRGR